MVVLRASNCLNTSHVEQYGERPSLRSVRGASVSVRFINVPLESGKRRRRFDAPKSVAPRSQLADIDGFVGHRKSKLSGKVWRRAASRTCHTMTLCRIEVNVVMPVLRKVTGDGRGGSVCDLNPKAIVKIFLLPLHPHLPIEQATGLLESHAVQVTGASTFRNMHSKDSGGGSEAHMRSARMVTDATDSWVQVPLWFTRGMHSARDKFAASVSLGCRKSFDDSVQLRAHRALQFGD